MAKSVVSIAKGTNAEKMVEEALNLLGGVTSLIRPNTTVVIKTNAISGAPPEMSICTSPAVLSAVIKEIRKAQPKEIIVTEGMRTAGLEYFEGSGQKKAAEEAGVDRMINIMAEKDLIKIPIRDHRGEKDFVMFPRFLVEADHFVNLPLFKTHVSMMFTAALKNLFGLLSAEDRRSFHWTGVSKGLMDVWSVCRADLNIVDMIRPGEGFGPLAPVPVDFGCIVAGKDPVAVDSTCCRMVGLDITKVPYFDAIKERNLGKYDEKDIEVRGKTVKEVFKKLWTPYLADLKKTYPEYHIHKNEGTCFLCEGLVGWSLERMKPIGEYDKHAGVHIVMGKAKDVPKGAKKEEIFLMGNCVPKQLRDKGIFVEGCPPWEMHPAWPIIERKWIDQLNWGRDYTKERMVFIEYEKEMQKKFARDKAVRETKASGI